MPQSVEQKRALLAQLLEREIEQAEDARESGAEAIDISELRRFLRSRLPGAMIPSTYVVLERLPRTPSGKLDRKALPAPGRRHERTTPHRAPSGELETALAAIWSELLGVERIGVEDNFFDLGGHSMLAMQVVYRIQSRFHVPLVLIDFLRDPTLKGLAHEVGARARLLASPAEDARSGDPAGAPAIPAAAVLWPEFQTDEGVGQAGTAFAIRLPGVERPLLVTALHLFSEVGGLRRQLSARELASVVRRVVLSNARAGEGSIAQASSVLPIERSAPLGTLSEAGDVAALWLDASDRITTLELASTSVRVSERVWLAAAAIVGGSQNRQLHAATVVGCDALEISYRYDDADLLPLRSSGAPLLDRSGRVVGIHVASRWASGRRVGIANPTARFRPYLERAAAGSAGISAGA
jgi:hypothetical protein